MKSLIFAAFTSFVLLGCSYQKGMNDDSQTTDIDPLHPGINGFLKLRHNVHNVEVSFKKKSSNRFFSVRNSDNGYSLDEGEYSIKLVHSIRDRTSPYTKHTSEVVLENIKIEKNSTKEVNLYSLRISPRGWATVCSHHDIYGYGFRKFPETVKKIKWSGNCNRVEFLVPSGEYSFAYEKDGVLLEREVIVDQNTNFLFEPNFVKVNYEGKNMLDPLCSVGAGYSNAFLGVFHRIDRSLNLRQKGRPEKFYFLEEPTVVFNGVTYTGLVDKEEINLSRVEVNDITLPDGTVVKGTYSIFRKDENRPIKFGCVAYDKDYKSWEIVNFTNIRTGFGIDLPQGNYKIIVKYKANGEDHTLELEK